MERVRDISNNNIPPVGMVVGIVSPVFSLYKDIVFPQLRVMSIRIHRHMKKASDTPRISNDQQYIYTIQLGRKELPSNFPLISPSDHPTITTEWPLKREILVLE